ncbi:TrbC/VirB2 family protein [Wolbachia endosymbiont (group A) of Pogonocherus hispidulus]|uniref:TrbC/VirB2 family protein n=1 Tax=Wolbachia endosymbiont (group A) of Pogonocherus hispidulus TaxID=3066136 RepID=UPI00397DCC2D
MIRLSIIFEKSDLLKFYKNKKQSGMIIERTMGNFLVILFIVFYAFDAHADGATDVMCNVIGYVHGIGGPMITVVIIGSSLLAIFGRMPWPALFSLGMFVAVFFGAPQIVKTVTEKEVCCLFKGQTLENGKCVAAPGYERVGTGYACSSGWALTNKGYCIKAGQDPSKYWK